MLGVMHCAFQPVGQGIFSNGMLYDDIGGNPWHMFRWVYDCGTVTGSNVLSREISSYRHHNPGAIDLLIVSHFDRDHINGIKDLLHVSSDVKILVLPYLTFAQRLRILIESTEVDTGYARAILQPAAVFRELAPGARIVFVTQGGDPPPEIAEGDGTNPETPWPKPPDSKSGPPSEHGGDSELQTANVFTVDSSQALLVRSWWEFCFYNRPRKDLESHFPQAAKKAYKVFNQSAKNNEDYNTLLKALKQAALKIVGKKRYEKSVANEISLVVYSGPVHRPSFEIRGCLPHIWPIGLRRWDIIVGNQIFPVDDPRRYHWDFIGKTSILYTGDITIDDPLIGELRRIFQDQRMQRVAYFQVPHHGSAKSWKVGTRGLTPPLQPNVSIFSSERYHLRFNHPNDAVIASLINYYPVFSNEFQGVWFCGYVQN